MQLHTEQGSFKPARPGQKYLLRIVALLAVTICMCLGTSALLIQSHPPAAHAASGPPLMGVNLTAPCDWCGDYVFTDVMKDARHWGSTSSPWDGSASVDANGWPTQDAGVVLLTPPSGVSVDGTYKVIFNGQATISGVVSSISISNQSYDASTNTTTADMHVGTNSQLYLSFTNTKRTASSSSGTGVTNVKVMLPTSFGASTSYDPSTTFTTLAENFLKKFRAIRFMDYSSTNGSTIANWSDRRLPTYFSMAASGAGNGAAWEYAIQLCNETGLDAYINVPALATDDYVTHLAQLFKYGSDANGNVYTSTQSNPVHPPLNSNLHLYIEYSNEVWNGSFLQLQQDHDAAVAEVNAGGSPLNYDGDPDSWHWAWRRIGKRIHDISQIFRGVFGNSAMPDGNAQIRPILEWQYGNAQDTAHQALSFLDDYYNNADGKQHVSTPHPVNYFIWGGGGAAYSGVNDPSATSVDAIYNSGYSTGVVPGTVSSDVAWGRAYGLMHDVAYEGGFQIGGDSPSSLQSQANLDPRATQMEVQAQTLFNQAGGELLMYFNASGSNYGLADPTMANQNTPKVQAIDQLNQSLAASPTNGSQLPAIVSINSGTFGVGARVNTLVISPSASSYNASLNMTTSYSTNTLQVLVNNVVVQTITIPQTTQQTSDVALNAISLPAGISSISIKGLSPTDTVLNTLTLSNGTPIVITPSATPPSLQQANIAQATTAPTIDGSGSDAIWSSASSNALTHVINSPSGFSASFQSAWDANNLYFLVKISDATFSGHADAVEIYLDPTHNGGTSYDPKDMQYVFASNTTTVAQYNNGQAGTNTAGVTYANATVSGGYNAEIKIPWSTLGVTPAANMVIGLDMDAVQNTSGGGNKLFWNTTTDNDWTNPSAFGRGVLQSGSGGTPTPTPTPTSTSTPTPTPTPTGGTNLAQGKTATASSSENSGTGPGYAVDGSTSTRWSSQYSDPQWLQVDLGNTVSVNEVKLFWETAYGKAYQIQVSNDATNWTTIYTQSNGSGGNEDLTGLSGSGRYIRMYGTQRGTGWGYSLWEFQVFGSVVNGTPSNLSQGKTATASSSENSGTGPGYAVDGSTSTRWSSQYSDPQWLQVDLGATYQISEVKLFWETAYGKAYQIQVSNDGTNWTTIYTQSNGSGGNEDLTGLSGSGRYVRMYGTQRGTGWGYSLWEFQVFGY